MKPLIGINAGLSPGTDGEPQNVVVRLAYVDAVAAAGGTPIILPSTIDEDAIEAQVKSCDGFVLVGGPDIDPDFYGQLEKHPTLSLLPPRRHHYDFLLINRILADRKPFLGICLGCQEINVALGGTLIQDIASQTSTTIQHSCKQAPYYMRQEVVVRPDTLISALVGAGTLLANTAHHQAIDQPGRGIRITSHCPDDGIIESYELVNYPFGLGVQWHPEMIADEPEHLNLFKGLVAAAVGAGPPATL